MTTYYHVSLELDSITSEFTPRVPGRIHDLENKDRERICLSTTIEGCLNAVPWGGVSMEETSSEFFDLNDEELHLAFRVYEFSSEDIKEGNLVTTEELLHQGLVMDACNTNEVWVIHQTLKPTKSYIALLTEYEDGMQDIYIKEYYDLSDEELDEVDIDEYIHSSGYVLSDIQCEFYSSIEEIPHKINWEEWNNRKLNLVNTIINA